MTTEEIRTMATSVAEEMKSAKAPLPRELRSRFIAVRAALFQRGVFDPVLARLDSGTVAQASPAELAEELAKVAAGL